MQKRPPISQGGSAATEVEPAKHPPRPAGADEREWKKVLKQKITKETKIKEANGGASSGEPRHRPVANTRASAEILPNAGVAELRPPTNLR